MSPLSRPDSRPDPIGGSEPSSGCETQDWDSLPDFFFFLNRTGACGYDPHLKTEFKYYIQIKELPSKWCPSNLYTFIESHLLIQNCTFTFTN